ncbi:MAG TPA: HipA family kinase [Bryobacteraceae bacterium]|nr:HipA family kinase [Bryobacteraceae bacterium]
MPLTAVRHVRKMRGGAQAHLLEADDGHWYVVKFRNNPQHRRVLVNELLSATFLDYLKIASPATAMVRITPEFLKCNPDVHLTLGTRRLPVESGWHFGSQYPGDPSRTAVYDFLPDALLSQVVNLEEFRAILVFDKWTGNADGRQSVFYRAMVRGGEAGAGKPGFVARMIDHGFAFNGPNWDFPESPLQGLYARRMVYDGVRSLADFEPWLEQVVHFPEEVMDQAWKRIPPEWVEGDEEALERLLEQLFARRKRLPELITSCKEGRANPFVNWL